jgi:hypothetical protein
LRDENERLRAVNAWLREVSGTRESQMGKLQEAHDALLVRLVEAGLAEVPR